MMVVHNKGLVLVFKMPIRNTLHVLIEVATCLMHKMNVRYPANIVKYYFLRLSPYHPESLFCIPKESSIRFMALLDKLFG